MSSVIYKTLYFENWIRLYIVFIIMIKYNYKVYLIKKNGGDYMPNNEKELNCYLFDQLSILERLERVAKEANADTVLKEIEFERKQIERKLYQKPPLAGEW